MTENVPRQPELFQQRARSKGEGFMAVVNPSGSDWIRSLVQCLEVEALVRYLARAPRWRWGPSTLILHLSRRRVFVLRASVMTV